MRKIISQEELALKNQKRNRWIGMFLLIILVASSAGFAFMNNSDSTPTTENKEGKVQNIGNRYSASFGDQTFTFTNSPESSFNVTTIDFIPDSSRYVGKPLYIVSESETIYYEIAYNLGRFAERAQHGCYDDCSNSTWPQKNCSDNLIVYKNSNENLISQNESCIFIEGDMRAVDAFLYREIGIS